MQTKSATRGVPCQSLFLNKVAVSFLIKLQAYGLQLYLKKGLWRWRFPVSFVKFLFCKTPYLQNTSGSLLLDEY